MQEEPGLCSNQSTSLAAESVREAVTDGSILGIIQGRLPDLSRRLDEVESKLRMLSHTVSEQEADLADLQSDFAATRQEMLQRQAGTSKMSLDLASLEESTHQFASSASELGEQIRTTTRHYSIRLEAWAAIACKGKPSCC